jgi:hypothetical protein
MTRNRSKLDLDREQITLALREWKEEVNLRAFGATCPMPHCGALAVTYECSDNRSGMLQSAVGRWEFVCPECAAEFTVPGSDLLFDSVPREWLFAQVSYA